VADGGEDDVGGIALAALEMAAAEVTVGLHVSDHGLDGAVASQFALDDAEDAALLWHCGCLYRGGPVGRTIIDCGNSLCPPPPDPCSPPNLTSQE